MKGPPDGHGKTGQDGRLQGPMAHAEPCWREAQGGPQARRWHGASPTVRARKRDLPTMMCRADVSASFVPTVEKHTQSVDPE